MQILSNLYTCPVLRKVCSYVLVVNKTVFFTRVLLMLGTEATAVYLESNVKDIKSYLFVT